MPQAIVAMIDSQEYVGGNTAARGALQSYLRSKSNPYYGFYRRLLFSLSEMITLTLVGSALGESSPQTPSRHVDVRAGRGVPANKMQIVR